MQMSRLARIGGALEGAVGSQPEEDGEEQRKNSTPEEGSLG